MSHPFTRLAAACAALAAAPVIALAAPVYHVTDLGPGYAWAQNVHGDVGGAQSGKPFHAETWHAGKHRVLPDFGRGGQVYGLNESRVAAGTAIDADDNDHAVMWTADGEFVDLGAHPGASTTFASNVAKDGTVYGQWVADNVTHAFVHDASGTHDFPALAAGDSTGVGGLNAKGAITGGANVVPGGPWHVFTWTPTEYADLGMPDGATQASGVAINGKGHVAGTWKTATFQTRSFLLKNGKYTKIGTLGGANSYAGDVNADDVVVGQAETGVKREQHPFVWQDGLMTDLTTALDADDSGNDLQTCFGIEDDGRIFCQGLNRVTRLYHVLILTPLAQ